MTKKIWWASLSERNPSGTCAAITLAVGIRAGEKGYTNLSIPYGQTAAVRNFLCAKFLELSTQPTDTLVMLDADHAHPPDIIERLVAHEGLMVVCALAQRRGPPYDPIVIFRDEKGNNHSMAAWAPGSVVQCDAVSPAAVAIQRRTFGHLEAEGFVRPWFRYTYTDGKMEFPSEDMYWFMICQQAHIPHHVDTGIIIPHHTDGWVTPDTWTDYYNANPEVIPPTMRWQCDAPDPRMKVITPQEAGEKPA